MISKFIGAAVLMCALSYASAGTTVIGTANARGDLRVDGYAVKGNATLFDGTVVETGAASAAIRMKSGAEIKLATNSRGQLFADHLVLQRGSTEVDPSDKITLEANGLHVAPSVPNSKGTVSISENDDTVQVAALTGQFRVTSAGGALLAKVDTGKAMSFDPPQDQQSQLPSAATPKGPVKMTIHGTLTHTGNHYYLNLPAPDLGYVYEVQGSNLDSFVGKTVVVNGMVDVSMKPAGRANYVLMANAISEEVAPTESSRKRKAILATVLLGGAAGTAIGIYEANQNPAPASR